LLALISDNSEELFEVIKSLYDGGQDFALLSPKLKAPQLEDVLKRLKPRQVYFGGDKSSRSLSKSWEKEARGDTEFSVESLGELAASDGLKDKPIQKNLENQKIVFLTSGSSGKPKLISHSRQTLEAAAAASNRATGLGTSHSWLIALPFYHLGGFSIFVRCKLAGAQAFLAEGNESSLSSSSLLKSLQRSCPDFLSLVPKQLEGLVKEEETWSRPKVILIGGAPLSPELRKRAREKALPVIETGGMTEAASSLAFLSEKRELIRLDNVSLRASASSKDLGENELSMEVQSTGVY